MWSSRIILKRRRQPIAVDHFHVGRVYRKKKTKQQTDNKKDISQPSFYRVSPNENSTTTTTTTKIRPFFFSFLRGPSKPINVGKPLMRRTVDPEVKKKNNREIDNFFLYFHFDFFFFVCLGRRTPRRRTERRPRPFRVGLVAAAVVGLVKQTNENITHTHTHTHTQRIF